MNNGEISVSEQYLETDKIFKNEFDSTIFRTGTNGRGWWEVAVHQTKFSRTIWFLNMWQCIIFSDENDQKPKELNEALYLNNRIKFRQELWLPHWNLGCGFSK